MVHVKFFQKILNGSPPGDLDNDGPHSLILPVPQYLATPLKVPFPGVKKACHSTFVSTLWFIMLTSKF